MPEQGQDWAKEPLDWDVFDNDAWDTTLQRYVIDEATRARIKACYDACAGVPTELLTDFAKWFEFLELHQAQDFEGFLIKIRRKGTMIGEIDIDEAPPC